MVQVIWLTILLLLLLCVYILDVNIDETREGRMVIWYTTPFTNKRNRKIF